jgi:hypothetical protein
VASDAAPGAPYQEAYRDVPLRFAGRHGGCAGDQFADLHRPAVTTKLAPSDLMFGGICPSGEPELQFGTTPAVTPVEADPGPQQCASALRSRPELDRYEPVAGDVLCVVATAVPELGRPAKLVRLEVSSVDAATGAVELRATAWLGS